MLTLVILRFLSTQGWGDREEKDSLQWLWPMWGYFFQNFFLFLLRNCRFFCESTCDPHQNPQQLGLVMDFLFPIEFIREIQNKSSEILPHNITSISQVNCCVENFLSMWPRLVIPFAASLFTCCGFVNRKSTAEYSLKLASLATCKSSYL